MAFNYTGFQERGYQLTAGEVRAKQLQIMNAYKTSLAQVQNDIQALYSIDLLNTDPKEYYKISIKGNRLAKLEKKIALDVKVMQKQVNKLTADASELAIANNYYRQQYATNFMDPYSFTVINKPLENYAVYQRAEVFKRLSAEAQEYAGSRSGIVLRELLHNNNARAITNINNTLNSGIIQGHSYRQIASNMNDTFNGNMNNSLRVARTEAHRTANIGQLAQWDDAKKKGVKGKRMILAVLDTRTRQQSQQVDGLTEEPEGYFLYPSTVNNPKGVKVYTPGNSGVAGWDINDRETAVNLINGQKPTLRRGRNPATGKNEAFSYKEFDQWAEQNGLKRNDAGKWVYNKHAKKAPKPTATVKPTAPKAPQFTPAKTTKEAELWAKENGIAKKVNYGALNVNLANQTNEHLLKLKNKYNKTFSNINVIHKKKSRAVMSSESARDAITDELLYEKLVINKARFNGLSGDKLDDYMAGHANKKLLVARNYKDIITHEYGHLLTQTKTRKLQDFNLGGLSGGNSTIEGIEELSTYANYNNNESLAEIFTKYSQGEKVKKEWIDFFNKYSEVKI